MGTDCVNCGARLSPGATYCRVCGVFVGEGRRRQRACPNCGTPVAQQAKSCIMCDAPLDRLAARGGLTSVSWPWIGAVTLVVALVAFGWGRWRNQPQPVVDEAPTPAPTSTATTTPTSLSTATPIPSPSHTPSPVPSPAPVIHVVQAGDTLIYIASQYGTTVEEIMQANQLDEASARLLRSGQELLIPSQGPVGGPAPIDRAQPPQVIHEVQAGDTLISIAIEYGTTTEAIMDANQLDSPDLIYEGQQIIVPLMPPTATPTLTPSPTLTPTPGPPYPAPQLLAPPNHAVLSGEETTVFLSWTSVDILPADYVYLVELQLPGGDSPLTHATQGTSWRLPSDLWPTGRQRTFTWRVTVMQQTGLASDGSPEWQAVSLPSEERRFEWR